MVENRGNALGYVGGGDRPPGSLPHGGAYYEPHKPQPRRPRVTALEAANTRSTGVPSCSVCGQPSDDLVDDVCDRCRAIVATRFDTPTDLPAAPEARPFVAEEGEPAGETVAAVSSRPAPERLKHLLPPPPPAWHADVLQLLIDTEGHPDPFVKAARKVVANGLVQLAKAHRATTTPPPAAATPPTPKRRPPRTTFDDAKIAQVVELYNNGAGLSPPDIGRRIGATAKAIRHCLDVAGVERVDGRITHSGGRKKTAADDDPVVVELIRGLYVDQGQTLEQIADQVAGSVKLVTNILRRAGVQLRPSASAVAARARANLTADERDAICRRYAAGEQGPALAAEFDVSRNAVYSCLRAAGVTVRPRPGRPRQENTDV